MTIYILSSKLRKFCLAAEPAELIYSKNGGGEGVVLSFVSII